MGILYRKKIEKKQEGGTITLQDVPTLYDPSKDYWEQVAVKQDMLDAQTKARNNARYGKPPKPEKKPKPTERLKAGFLTGGPKATRKALNDSLEDLMKQINTGLDNNEQYLTTPEGSIKAMQLERLTADKQSYLTRLGKLQTNLTARLDVIGDEAYVRKGTYYVLDSKENTFIPKSMYDYAASKDEKKADGTLRYQVQSVKDISFILNSINQKDDTGYTEALAVKSWDEVKKEIIDPVSSKIKPTTITTSAGKNTPGLTINDSHIPLRALFKVLQKDLKVKGFEHAKPILYDENETYQTLGVSTNTQGLTDALADIQQTIENNTSYRDALFTKVLNEQKNIDLLNAEKDQTKKADLLGQMATQQIYEDVFLSEQLSETLKTMGEDAPEEEKNPSGIEPGDQKINNGNTNSIYGLQNSKTDDHVLVGLNEKGAPSDNKYTVKAIEPTQFQDNLKAKITALQKEGNSATVNNYGLNSTLDFKNMLFAGNYTVAQLTGTNGTIEALESSILSTGQIINTGNIKAFTAVTNAEGNIDQNFTKYAAEVTKETKKLYASGRYDASDLKSINDLNKNVFTAIASKPNSVAAKYQLAHFGKDYTEATKKVLTGQRFIEADFLFYYPPGHLYHKGKQMTADSKGAPIEEKYEKYENETANLQFIQNLGVNFNRDMMEWLDSSSSILQSRVLIPAREYPTGVISEADGRDKNAEYAKILKKNGVHITRRDGITFESLITTALIK